MDQTITTNRVDQFAAYLLNDEKSPVTISKYKHDILTFYHFLPNQKQLTKQLVMDFKKQLISRYQAASVNSMLAAVNSYLVFAGRSDCTVKGIKTQQNIFIREEKILTRQEYLRLLKTAEANGNQRLCLIMQTICATGIRISELPFITVSAAAKGRAYVSSKNKTRGILIPSRLCRLLNEYAKRQEIKKGPVFLTRNHTPISRNYIWAEMKKLCIKAEVAPTKVFPHNLRHLFARTFYERERDIVRLGDILGHSNIETTRIYTISFGREHALAMEHLGLVMPLQKYP